MTLVLLGCSSQPGEGASTAPSIVPEGLRVTALAGGNGVLELSALTLQRGELYAALRNRGDRFACDAALSVELFDRSEQSVAAGISGLLTQRWYRLTDDSHAVAACVAPGELTMAAITDLPRELAVEDVGSVVYRCPYFALDVVPIDGLAVRGVRQSTSHAVTAYTGTLENRLDVAVQKPSVTIFAVDRVGRPLGAAIATSDAEIPPGGSWPFETNSVREPGVNFEAYPAGAITAASSPRP